MKKVMTWEAVQRDILSRYPSGKFRFEVMAMIESFKQRGFIPERASDSCKICDNSVKGIRWTDAKNVLVDSWGFVEDFDGTQTCYICLNEGYVGDIFVLPTKRIHPN